MPDTKIVVNLRTVAERVGLAPGSVSAVLNRTPASMAIPQQTRDRVFRAAAELNYQPNLSARSLRTKRSHMIAVVSGDFGRGAVGHVVAGMEQSLREKGYLLVLGALRSPSEWMSLSAQLRQRCIEGVVAVGVNLPRELRLPVVSVHLDHVNLPEPFSPDVTAWLAALGESAAEAVLSKIETNPSARRTRIVPQLPQGYLSMPVASVAEAEVLAQQA